MVSGVKVSKGRQSHSLRSRNTKQNTNSSWNGRSRGYPVSSHPSGYKGRHSNSDGDERGRCKDHIRCKYRHPEKGAWRHGRPALKPAFFNWDAQNKYVELLSFEMEVTKILWMKTYKVIAEEKVPIIKNCLGREVLQLIKTFKYAETETWRTARELFTMLSEKFKPCL